VVRVERGAGVESEESEVAGRCAAAIKETLGIEAAVTVLERETIPRSGYKAARVVDE
jgi:phenylacetate-coenzyme A ligase PaaK-like adenylate-forming protein